MRERAGAAVDMGACQVDAQRTRDSVRGRSVGNLLATHFYIPAFSARAAVCSCLYGRLVRRSAAGVVALVGIHGCAGVSRRLLQRRRRPAAQEAKASVKRRARALLLLCSCSQSASLADERAGHRVTHPEDCDRCRPERSGGFWAAPGLPELHSQHLSAGVEARPPLARGLPLCGRCRTGASGLLACS